MEKLWTSLRATQTLDFYHTINKKMGRALLLHALGSNINSIKLQVKSIIVNHKKIYYNLKLISTIMYLILSAGYVHGAAS